MKKKTLENLMHKWNEDITLSTNFTILVTPPYIQSISGYFQEKLMPKARQLKEGIKNK
jgi:hypothetical protein